MVYGATTHVFNLGVRRAVLVRVILTQRGTKGLKSGYARSGKLEAACSVGKSQREVI